MKVKIDIEQTGSRDNPRPPMQPSFRWKFHYYYYTHTCEIQAAWKVNPLRLSIFTDYNFLSIVTGNLGRFGDG